MKSINHIATGSGSGSEPAPPRQAVEAPNSLRATTKAIVLDILCEGEIYGPANGDSWEKSTYLNETQVRADDGTLNFQGVTVTGRVGSSDQEYIPGHDKIRAAQGVGADVTEAGGPIARTVTNAGLTDVAVSIQVPRIWARNSDGDIGESSFQWRVTVTPDNGAGAEQTAIEDTVTGKCVSTYRRQRTIYDIVQYGPAPWVIKLYRVTADSADSNTINAFSWYSFTEIVDVKIRYSDSAAVGVEFDAELFGGQVPSRAYKIKGRLIKYPSNYNPTTREYTGIWDGTFATGYTNCPAWVANDILTEGRAAAGLPEVYVDKWWLYSAGQYCDELVTFKSRTRNADGSFSTAEVTEPRFTFNGIFQTPEQAMAVVRSIFSTFMAFPIWATGMASGSQDAPRDPDYTADPTEAKDGLFTYSGTSGLSRSSVVVVNYNNMDNFGRSTPIVREDQDAIARYGYNKREFAAIGCTSPHEAARRVEYTLDTDQNQTDSVSFISGLKFSRALPGDIVEIQDPAHVGKILYGKVTGSTTVSITADREIEIESGVTYTIKVASDSEVALHERVLTNSAGSTDTLTWSNPLSPAPTKGYSFVLAASSITPRQFEVLDRREIDGVEYEITGVEYDPGKYARIEEGIVVDGPPTTTMTVGKLSAPGTLNLKRYSYVSGDQKLRRYGLLASWEKSDDPRTLAYEVIYSLDGKDYQSAGQPTGLHTYELQDLVSGTYVVGVRGISTTGSSNYTYSTSYIFSAELNAPEPPTNLRCVDSGGVAFSGKDCEIAWDASVGSTFTDDDGVESVGTSNITGYRIQVYVGVTLIRTDDITGTSWTYTYSMNGDDNGSPSRNISFRVYTLATLGTLSDTYASINASNPAPDMSAITPTVVGLAASLDISWSAISDNDMIGYQIWIDGVYEDFVPHPGTTALYTDVETESTYNVQIIPQDGFGVGIGTQSAIGSPVKVPLVNLDVELAESITMSDSEGNTQVTLNALYDGVFSSGGVAYTLSGSDKYIEYRYNITNYFDRVNIYCADANARIYVGISANGSDWAYLKAQTDHTLPITGIMGTADSQTDARTNYLQLVAGLTVCMFPNNIFANRIRLYLTGTYSTTIYEFQPSRMLISELAAIRHLTTVKIQNSDGSSYVDMGNNTMALGDAFSYDGTTLEISVGAGSSGYGNYVDRPESLAEINQSEYNTLTGAIVTHFYEIPPTTANPPASSWTTDALKEDHLGDLYYDISTGNPTSGKVWRWIYTSATYQWSEVSDTGLATALAAANAAQATADSKIRFFILPANPTPPYDPGDVWKTTVGIKNCVTAKDDGELFAVADWELAADITDYDAAQATAEQLISDSAGVVFEWAGSEALNTSATIATADEWTFTMSDDFPGGIIQIEMDSGFAGELQVAVNNESLTTDEWDGLTITDDVGSVIDVSEPGKDPVDLGGLI